MDRQTGVHAESCLSAARSVQSCLCIYTAVDACDRVRPQTSSPIVHVPALSAGFVPIDPARPPPAQQQQHPPAQQAPLRRRRLPDIPKEEEGGDGGSVSVTAVVLRQRSVDGRPPVRPDSGVGLADLGVAATGALYAANRGSCQSVQLHGELLTDVLHSSIRQCLYVCLARVRVSRAYIRYIRGPLHTF